MKNIVITGGSSGVGLAIAKDLAQENNIIIIGRNKNKATIVRNNLGSHVKTVIGDLSKQSERELVIAQIKTIFPHIDVLIHSAGIMPRTASENINSNLLSHYYLTLGLRDVLSNSRILIVTGNPRVINLVPVCDIQNNTLARAAWLVTHKTLLMFVLADQLKDQLTTVNSFFPGDVRSELMDYTKTLTNTAVPVGKYLAMSPDIKQLSGVFFDKNGTIVPLNAKKFSFEIAQKTLQQYLR